MPQLIPVFIAYAASTLVPAAYAYLAATIAFTVSSYAINKSLASRQARRDKAAYNAQVEDRTIVMRSGTMPASSIYGQAIVGGEIIYTQSTGTKGEFLHIVVALSNREIQSIDGIFFNGEQLPEENGTTGFIESGNYVNTKTTTASQYGSGSGTTITLSNTPTRVIDVAIIVPSTLDYQGTDTILVLNTDYTVVGNVITLLGGLTATVNTIVHYEYSQTISYVVRVRKVLGAAGQVAFSELVSESGGKWTANHIGAGCAAVYIRLEYKQGVFGQIGIPEMKFLVSGFKVYDPRTGLTNWSNNAALCTADYLKDTRLGVGSIAATVVDSELTAAANACDELVGTSTSTFTVSSADDWLIHSGKFTWMQRVRITSDGTYPAPLVAATDYYVIRVDATHIRLATTAIRAFLGLYINITGAGTGTRTVTAYETRYTVNGSLPSTNSPRDNLSELADAMAGEVVWSGGRWLIRPGVGRTAEFTIDESYLAGDRVVVSPKAQRRQSFNAVSGTYIERNQKWAITQFPSVENAMYVTEDGGRRKAIDIELPLVDAVLRAQRIAKIVLERSRQALTVQLETNMNAYDLQVTDWVALNLSRYGFSNKLFEVTRRTLNSAGSISYELKETAAAIYDWAYGEATHTDLAPDTTLPSPFTPPAILTGLTASSGTNELIAMADGTLLSRVLFSWVASTDIFVLQGGYIEVMYTRSTDSTIWTVLPRLSGDATQTYIVGAPDGISILLAVRAVNGNGRVGPWQYLRHTVVGKTAAPSNVAGLTATVVTNGVRIDWTASPDIDYDETELRRGGTTWETGIPIVGAVSMGVRGNTWTWMAPAAGTYTIRAKHVDTSGNYSATQATASVTVTDADLMQWSDIANRPLTFRVSARGFASTAHQLDSGIYNGETGATIFGTGIYYRVVRINRSTGVATSVGVSSNGTTLAGYLNGITGTADIVVVYSYDEPQTPRNTDFLNAMYKHGASRAVLGSPLFPYRGAYILIGISNCGEGNGYEALQGIGGSGGTNDWVEVSFYLQNSNLVISGTTATPRTIQDYGYTGSLSATDGATWGSDISGQPADYELENIYVGGNLFPYPDAYWEVTTGTYGGSYIYHFRAAGADTYGAGFLPGEWVTVSCEMYVEAAVISAGKTGVLYLWAQDSAATWKAQAAATLGVASTWTRVSASVQLPASLADMYQISISPYRNPSGGSYSGYIWVQRIQVERGRVATAYAPMNVKQGVDTASIKDEAATTIATDYVASDSRTSTSTYHQICSASLTNNDTVARTMLVTGTSTMTYPNGIADNNIVRGHILPSSTSPTSGNFKYQHTVTTGEDRRFLWSAQEQVSVAAGATVTYGLWGWASMYSGTMYYEQSNLRLELIKR